MFKIRESQRVFVTIIYDLDYKKRNFDPLPDKELENMQESYRNSRLRSLLKQMPVLGQYLRYRETQLDLALETRRAVRRAERGEAVCGITGF